MGDMPILPMLGQSYVISQDNLILRKQRWQICKILSPGQSAIELTLCNKLRTTADPTATPPAVAAIWPNIDGCWDWAWAGAGAEGGAWAGRLRFGGGAALKNSPHRGYNSSCAAHKPPKKQQ